MPPPPDFEETCAMYKEFAGEVVMWLVPVVVLIGVALLVTA
ncbi:unnamed protein product [[Actinomadura] parvosata subsp. kistnae]|nr:hypothetical protein [Nonomuraea sp. ATCC 55076]SPL91955.1 unnamed protein product [Actinomadura parvosata subsp. kistnae]